MLIKKAQTFKFSQVQRDSDLGKNCTALLECILVENEHLAIGMMQDYINGNENLRLLGTAKTLAELKALTDKEKPEIIFLDLIIPSGGCEDFDFGKLPENATIVVVSGIPLSMYDKRHLLNRPVELPKPVSHEEFNRCIESIINGSRGRI